MTDKERLSLKAREVLALPNEERIRHILEDRWVGYTRANEIIAKLEDLLDHPKVGRMPNMLIIGNTNNGKSHLVEHFLSLHPATDNPVGAGIIVPVLLIEAPDKPDISHLYSIILDMLNAPYKSNDKEEIKLKQVIKVLNSIDLGIIVIDEIHNLIAGPLLKQRAYLNAIRYLGNKIKRSIVGVGTVEALRAIQVDSQLSNRFTPVVLPAWGLDKEFLRLLASLESIIPLRDPSNLIDKTMAMKLHAMSEGTIGELSTLINNAAVWAIRNTKAGEPERIDINALNKCGFIPPSLRKEVARKL
ncbi:MAG: TniB family NTP-binding protein [Gallionella sp.]|nr:TniB family NTP-binding protein [Gallionella sp.]